MPFANGKTCCKALEELNQPPMEMSCFGLFPLDTIFAYRNYIIYKLIHVNRYVAGAFSRTI